MRKIPYEHRQESSREIELGRDVLSRCSGGRSDEFGDVNSACVICV